MPKAITILRLINVEPMLFLYSISHILYNSVYQAFFAYKECVSRLSATGPLSVIEIHDYCQQLGSSKDTSERHDNSTCFSASSDELSFLNDVQAATAIYTIVYQVTNTLPAIVAALFMGAWCDSHGRKPIILVATTGTTVAMCLAVATACLDMLPLSVMTAVALVKSFTGHGVIINLAAFAMISDVATSKTVFTIRIGIASGMMSLGSFLGSLLSGLILAHWDNFAYIFLLSALFSTLAFFYALFFIVETYQWAIRRRASLIQDPESVAGYDDEPIDAYFDCQPTIDYDYNPRNFFFSILISMRESIYVVIRERQGKRRLYLLISLLAFMTIFICEPGITNLYLKRPPLSFTNSLYSYYSATTTAVGVVGGMILPVLMKRYFAVTDVSLILTGIVISVFRKCVFAFSTEKWMIFSAAIFGGMSQIYTTGFRSYIPSLVQRTETGRLFAAISSVEQCGPMLSALIGNNIYAATLNLFPGAVYLLGGSLATLLFTLVSFIQLDSQIIEGTIIKWCDEENEWNKRRISMYDSI